MTEAPGNGVSASEIAGQICRRIGTLRSDRDWSLDELSAACGVSRSMLSQIEREKANPTLAVTLRIAHAFGMELSELVETAPTVSRIDVIRAEDAQYHYRSDADCEIRTLSPLHLEKDVEFYEVRLQPSAALSSAPHFEGSREFLTVEKGKVGVDSSTAHVQLSRGDSASYRADVPHTITNLGRGETLLFLVVIYP